MSTEEKEELESLRKEFYSNSLGDRPHSPSVEKIEAIIDFRGRRKARKARTGT